MVILVIFILMCSYECIVQKFSCDEVSTKFAQIVLALAVHKGHTIYDRIVVLFQNKKVLLAFRAITN